MSHNIIQSDSNIRDFARRITALGLRPLALFALEAGRPLALPAAQLIWLTQPVLAVAWKPAQVAQWAQFLEAPGSIDRLIEQFESDS